MAKSKGCMPAPQPNSTQLNSTQPNTTLPLFNSSMSQTQPTFLLAADTTPSCSGFRQAQPDATGKQWLLRQRRRPSSPACSRHHSRSQPPEPTALGFFLLLLALSSCSPHPPSASGHGLLRVSYTNMPSPAQPVLTAQGWHCTSPAPPSPSSILVESLKLWFKQWPPAPGPVEDMVIEKITAEAIALLGLARVA